MPTSFVATKRDVDPVLDGLAQLTLAVSPISHDVAMLGLDEVVIVANSSELDTGQGRAGFDINTLKKLAMKDESRVRQAAESFKDPFRRLVSLAAIDHCKAADLEERYKRLPQKSQEPRRVN